MTQVSHARQQQSFHAHPPAREVSLDQARALVTERTLALRQLSRFVPLSQWSLPGVAPVLAEPVVADRAWPPFRRSMRDGYALRFADGSAPVRCVGELRAGAAAAPLCGPGECVAIMTGAPVPEELDTVVMIEHTQIDQDGRILVNSGEHKGDNIAAAGSDSAPGSLVAAASRRLTPAALAAAASAGVTDPLVFAAPRVAILASGDELVPASVLPGPVQIRNSNGPMLAAQCRRYGAEVVCERLLPDTESALEAALDHALAMGAELILFSGGASVGSADLVAPLLVRRGVRLAYDAVRVRPGRPVLFGECEGRLYFGLPGNPLGALMACALQVRPALELLSGMAAESLTPATVTASLGFDYSGKPLALDVFRPVRLAASGLRATVQPLTYHGSADLAAAAAADAFLHVPPGVTALHAGDTVGVVLL
ncbi:MAG: molybdopterin molybdotransferase MoeA [Terriglobales bacterium]